MIGYPPLCEAAVRAVEAIMLRGVKAAVRGGNVDEDHRHLESPFTLCIRDKMGKYPTCQLCRSPPILLRASFGPARWFYIAALTCAGCCENIEPQSLSSPDRVSFREILFSSSMEMRKF